MYNDRFARDQDLEIRLMFHRILHDKDAHDHKSIYEKFYEI